MRSAYWQADRQPGSPSHNMEADAALLEAIVNGRLFLPVIRIYQWDRPSVSIGRLQPEEPVQRLYPHLPIVRRPTGGRAVLHGEDLTITIATRTDWLPGDSGRTTLSSYRLLMAGLMAALKEAGHDVSVGTEKLRGNRGSIQCFDLAAGCDLVDAFSGRKLVGSAQRRDGNAILQQMSLPLSLLMDKTTFCRALQREFQQALGIEEWQFIDTMCTVCYTKDEESEGSRPWHAKF